RRHTRFSRDWSSDVCSSDLTRTLGTQEAAPSGGLPVCPTGPDRPYSWLSPARPFVAPPTRAAPLSGGCGVVRARGRGGVVRWPESGRASCRERVYGSVFADS